MLASALVCNKACVWSKWHSSPRTGRCGVLEADEKVESSIETDGHRVILAGFFTLCKDAVLEVGLGAATSTPSSSASSDSDELPPCEADDSSSDSSEATIRCFAADRESRCRASDLLLRWERVILTGAGDSPTAAGFFAPAYTNTLFQNHTSKNSTVPVCMVVSISFCESAN